MKLVQIIKTHMSIVVAILLIFLLVLSARLLWNNFFQAKSTLEMTDGKKYIAIIIDDFGNNSDGTKEMLELKVPITAAVMPAMPSSEKDAEDFYKAGKGVILHMPMEAKQGRASWLGPRAITSDLSQQEVSDYINQSLDELKYAQGINNHMGSKITASKGFIETISEIIKERDMIFIDSKTTSKSVISSVAKENGVKYLERTIFLDGTTNVSQIEAQLLKAGEQAQTTGYSIAIGHVGVEGGKSTAKAIANIAPQLEQKGIEFVTVTELYEILNSSLSVTED